MGFGGGAGTRKAWMVVVTAKWSDARNGCKDHFVDGSREEVTKVRSSTPPQRCIVSFEFSRETLENS